MLSTIKSGILMKAEESTMTERMMSMLVAPQNVPSGMLPSHSTAFEIEIAESMYTYKASYYTVFSDWAP